MVLGGNDIGLWNQPRTRSMSVCDTRCQIIGARVASCSRAPGLHDRVPLALVAAVSSVLVMLFDLVCTCFVGGRPRSGSACAKATISC